MTLEFLAPAPAVAVLVWAALRLLSDPRVARGVWVEVVDRDALRSHCRAP